jgi:CheY-like chemotaxis protein
VSRELADAPAEATGTVLVVDDEELVRDVAAEILREVGFEVITATNGREAVDLFRHSAREIAAVLLDLTMPELSGEEAFRELRSIRDDVPIVLTSGYDEQEMAQRFEGLGVSGFVKKPYVFERLAGAMRSATRN